MSDKLKKLYEKVSGDDSLKESLVKGLGAISNDDEKKSFIIEFAKEQGIELTMEDFPKTDGVKPLSDDDMKNVVGGSYGDVVGDACEDPAFVVCSMALFTAGLYDC